MMLKCTRRFMILAVLQSLLDKLNEWDNEWHLSISLLKLDSHIVC